MSVFNAGLGTAIDLDDLGLLKALPKEGGWNMRGQLSTYQDLMVEVR